MCLYVKEENATLTTAKKDITCCSSFVKIPDQICSCYKMTA